MSETNTLLQLLERWGSHATTRAAEVLVQDIEAELLLAPLRSLAQHRRDLLRSSLVTLACAAVGGKAEEATPAATAMVLEGYYLGVLDDIIDKSREKLFRPTLSGKYGADAVLLVSIIIDAKAHHALSELLGRLDSTQYVDVSATFQDFLVRMMEGEALNVRVKQQGVVDSQDLLKVFEKQAADVEACTRLGAIIGGASTTHVESLAKYGRTLGILLLLNDDNRDAFHLTLELDDKIRSGSYPYPLMWAANHSMAFQQFLQSLNQKKSISPKDVKHCVAFLFDSGAVTHVRELMKKMATEAVSTLGDLKDSEAKRALDFIATRQPYVVLGHS